MKLKDACSLKKKKKAMINLDSILKSRERHYFASKDLSSQSYVFSSSHVWMWELDHKKSWMPKNWCFWTVVLEKTPESLLGCKEIQPVHSKGDQSWDFFGRTEAEAETPILWHLMWKPDSFEKTLMLGKIEGRRRSSRQRMRWLNGITDLRIEFEEALGNGDEQGSLACCSPWDHKKSDTTEQLNWTELVISLLQAMAKLVYFLFVVILLPAHFQQ